MSEEEKKAIEIIKFLQNKCIQENGTGMMCVYRIDDLANAIETVLNLIEKQQKDYISKDKIREKIEELERDKNKLYKEQENIEEIKIYSVIDIIKAEILRFKEILEEE